MVDWKDLWLDEYDETVTLDYSYLDGIETVLDYPIDSVELSKADLEYPMYPEWSDEDVLYCRVCLKYPCGRNIEKAAGDGANVIDTPMGDDGKFNADAVPAGASVWITVTNPSSPMHRRPILITKRPDGLFALTGGGGKEVDARRHMIVTGKPKKTKRDEELDRAAKEAEEFNEPLIQERRQIDREAKAAAKQAGDQLLRAMQIDKRDREQLKLQRDKVQEYVASSMGIDMDSDEAKGITDTLIKQALRAETSVSHRSRNERQLAILQAVKQKEKGLSAEVIDISPPIAVPMPDLEQLKDLTPEEQQAVVGEHFQDHIREYHDNDKPEPEPPLVEEGEEGWRPTFLVGTTIKPLELKNEEELGEAVSSIQNYHQKRKEFGEVHSKIKKVPAADITPSTMAAIKNEEIEPVSLDDIEAQVEEDVENRMRSNKAAAIYGALSKNWNDDISVVETIGRRKDTSLQFHLNAGAATALSAMGKDQLGVRLDAARLISDGSIEMGAAGLALEVARQHAPDSDEYNSVVKRVRNFNANNQQLTEDVALSKHYQLERQWDMIQDQKRSGELMDEVRVSSLESDNIIAQRTNLGASIGSMQATATFYDYLTQLQRGGRDKRGRMLAPIIEVNVGDNIDAAEAIKDKLRLRDNRYEIDTTDSENIVLRLGLTSLSKYVKEAPDVTERHSKFEALKTNTSGVSMDDGGNMVVKDYTVPGWNSTFKDAEGNEVPYHWRVEQRNDIEWLREATKKTSDNPTGVGGGLITRVTGAGKTNTALGFFGHKMADNPDYKGMVVVPRGRSEQWVTEANKFSDLNVELIPDGMAKSKVDEVLATSKPGTIYVMGHREASRSHEVISAVQTMDDFSDSRFSGMVIDEPHELQARGLSGNVGALGKRLMKLPVSHRIGLTATPAKRNPTEAYDLIKWTQGSSKDIGSKAGFVRTFSGFGSGTNAMDASTSSMFFNTIQPFISGDRITDPNFKVEHQNRDVTRSETQVARQKEIEANSNEYIQNRRAEIVSEVRNNADSGFRKRKNWEYKLGAHATKIARGEVQQQHVDNMDGGDFNTNGKMQNLRQSLESDSDKKHVIYIDSATQRRTLAGMLKDMGLKVNQYKNLASSTGSIRGVDMARRARAFQEDPNVKLIMIDKVSSSGYNLQAGDSLHVLGSPDNAATYLQSQGRLARMPRTGDVSVNTYKYSDNPGEQSHWNNLETQIKVLRASAPAMFSG